MTHRIIITEFMDASAVARLRASFDVHYDPELLDKRDELKARIADTAALIVRNLTQVNREILDAAKDLKVVGRLGVGLDNIDIDMCKARGITVIPAAGANALSVAEYVIGTSMLMLRGAYASSEATAAGNWPRARLSLGAELSGKTLGLVGFGEIGRLVARLAQGLGMKVIAHDPMLLAGHQIWRQTGVTDRALDHLVAEADVISLHVPLTGSTRNMFDTARLRHMKKGAFLINTARGGIVDEAALAKSLIDGHLGGAAIDVFAEEPLAAGSPLAKAVAAGVTNLVLTPHIAGLTIEANQRVSEMIAAGIAEFLEKLPRNQASR